MMGIFTNFRGAIGAMALTGYGLSVKLFTETTVEECVANFKAAIEDFQTKNIVIKFYESTNTLRTEFDAQVTRNYPAHFFKAWNFGLHEMMKLITPEEANSNLRDLCQEKLEENKLSGQIANVCLVTSAIIIVCILLPKVFSFVKNKPVSPPATAVEQIRPYHKRPPRQPLTVQSASASTPSICTQQPSPPSEKKEQTDEELRQKRLQEQLYKNWNTAKNNARKHK